jgi:hypothetical protein
MVAGWSQCAAEGFLYTAWHAGWGGLVRCGQQDVPAMGGCASPEVTRELLAGRRRRRRVTFGRRAAARGIGRRMGCLAAVLIRFRIAGCGAGDSRQPGCAR